MLTIRDATPADVPTILALVRELATYEREPDAVVATEADFLRHGFGDRPFFKTLIAEWDGEAAGFALFFYGFSTWTGGPTLYLEDLFVRPAHRKKQIGLSLMRRLAKLAVENGCTRFIWQVLDWNEPSLRFYETLGAKVLREWLTARLEGEALGKLAGDPTPPAP
ncbi:MAG: N-acetyltransferase family protein [Polyangiaceae bacterium]|jgi:GNAT superfamily N-acetyltransferase